MATRRSRPKVTTVGKNARESRKRAAARARSKTRTPSPALVHRSDVVRFVIQHATRIAAPDVSALATKGDRLRVRAATLEGARFKPFREQVEQAVGCIEDYSAGRCEQIPYYTIAVLAAALYYFHDAMDAIPDFLPQTGAIDDALVMAVATNLAAEGLERYRTWKTAGEPSREPRRRHRTPAPPRPRR